MPVLFEENRKRVSSAEKPAPRTPVTFMNCSIVYCFDGRAGAVPRGADCAAAWEATVASATSASAERVNDRDMRTPLEGARPRAARYLATRRFYRWNRTAARAQRLVSGL